ncbi:MAG TPA: hypothetical protein VGG32_07665 [Thermoplasmata archaeon]|jgi:hypothetical protein
MEATSSNELERRRFKLVLPKTFFDQAFLVPHDSTVHGFKASNCYHFIANLVIEVTACLPENSLMAATTQRAWDEFSTKVRGRQFSLGGEGLLTVFQNLVVVIPTENWGALDDIESMIALADRLYATSSLDPLIVVNEESVNNYREAAARYYGKAPAQMNPLDVPFKIYNPIETKAHLQAIFPQEAKDVLKKTVPPYNIF